MDKQLPVKRQIPRRGGATPGEGWGERAPRKSLGSPGQGGEGPDRSLFCGFHGNKSGRWGEQVED